MGPHEPAPAVGGLQADVSESPDIKHDNRRRLFEHVEEHSEWANDSESNRFEARLTEGERVAGQPEVDLANNANQGKR